MKGPPGSSLLARTSLPQPDGNRTAHHRNLYRSESPRWLVVPAALAPAGDAPMH